MWDEQKHPRDEDGKFRKVGLLEGMGEREGDTESESLTGEKREQSHSINLSSREWRIWYEKIGEIKRGYAFKRDEEGNYLLPIGNKIVVTKYDYENPKVHKVWQFDTELDMIDYLEVHGDYYDD